MEALRGARQRRPPPSRPRPALSGRPSRGAAIGIGIGLAVGALGCSDSFGPERNELERARARWEAAALRDYRYEYRRVCFCPPLRAIVEVQDGEVIAAVDPETGAAVPEEELEPFPTVDELFDKLAEWISRDPHAMQVTYDPNLGYPRSAFFDFEFNVADEEQGFQASGLEPLADPPLEIGLPAVIVR